MAAAEEKKEKDAKNTYYTLNDGNKIPIIGFGTYKLQNGSNNKLSARDAVKYAISIGYRHIDTAIFYDNEKEVGIGIKEGCKLAGIQRKDIFLTTKLWSEGHEKTNDAKKSETVYAVNQSLSKLDCDYIDLYLIHSPYGGYNIKTYNRLLQFKKKGLIKSVGVSNFGIQHLKALEKAGCELPSVNQIELHPWLQQKEIVNYCKSKNILIESYSPLTKAQKLPNENKKIQQQSKENKILIKMKENYENKSIAQILLRWNVQTGHIVIAKSANKNRIKQNYDTMNWKLTNDDMNTLNEFDCDYHCTWDPTANQIDHNNDDW